MTDTTLGPSTQIDTIDMVSPELGYAVGSSPGVAGGHFYLLRSPNVGRTWTVQGGLPFPTLVSANTYISPIALDFLNPSVGYASTNDGPLFETVDAGTTWSRVRAPGTSPTFVVSSGHVFVVSRVCHAESLTPGASHCTNELSTFTVGSATARRSEPIARNVTGPSSTAVVLGVTSAGRVVIRQGAFDGGSTALISTADGGLHWETLANPCPGLGDMQMLSPHVGETLLYCFGAGGMNQGTSELWSSRDQMVNWSLVAKADEQGSTIGEIGDVSNTLSLTKDHKVLFGVLGGAAGGLEYSTDSGAHWKKVDLPLAWYGGANEYLSTYGASSAVFGVQGGPQFQTTNATRWTPLPQLRAGAYRGLSICTQETGTHAHRSATMTGIPATSLDFPIIFSNTGSVACYLNGVPSVQPVAGGATRANNGRAFPVTVKGRGGFVILNAHGGTASIVVESDALNSVQRRACSARVMTALTIGFNPPATFRVATPAHYVCEGANNLRNSGVTTGLVTWLG